MSLRGGRRSWGPGVCPALTLANGLLGQLSTPTQPRRFLRPSRAGPGLDAGQTRHGGQCRPSSHNSPPTYVTRSKSVGGLRGLRGAGGQPELPKPPWGSDPRWGKGAGRRWHLTPLLQEPSARSQPRDPPALPRATPQEARLPLPASPERRGRGQGVGVTLQVREGSGSGARTQKHLQTVTRGSACTSARAQPRPGRYPHPGRVREPPHPSLRKWHRCVPPAPNRGPPRSPNI